MDGQMHRGLGLHLCTLSIQASKAPQIRGGCVSMASAPAATCRRLQVIAL